MRLNVENKREEEKLKQSRAVAGIKLDSGPKTS